MKILLHKHFVKNFDKRIKSSPQLLQRFNERYKLFIKDETSIQLHSHRLAGAMKGKQSFSITGDLRIIFQKRGDTVEFLDIGTHNQVYK
jgi:addiction module RelE/StbE family toxin